MTRFKTPLEIYALLPKTNCGECGIATCLAFAAAVLKEEKHPADCPRLDQAALPAWRRDQEAGQYREHQG